MRLCFNTAKETAYNIKPVINKMHSNKVKPSVTLNKYSCFLAVCRSSLVNTVSETL